MIWQHDIRDLCRDLRRRILAETEQFLARCLSDPKLGIRIPRIKIGAGKFSPAFAKQFWADVLGEDVVG